MHLLYMPNRHHTRAMGTFVEYILAQARGEMPKPPVTEKMPTP